MALLVFSHVKVVFMTVLRRKGFHSSFLEMRSSETQQQQHTPALERLAKKKNKKNKLALWRPTQAGAQYWSSARGIVHGSRAGAFSNQKQ